MTPRRLRVVAISDTHSLHDQRSIPEGDVLVHSGDLTSIGRLDEVEAFDDFLSRLPHPHKVVIAGNHDWCFERTPREARALLRHAAYLEDSGLTIEGVRFWGSPWQPWFMSWAFNLPRGRDLAEKWALIPSDTDVLLTHGPPMGVLDTTWRGEHVGCEALAEAVSRVRPGLHVFGHIHEAYGVASDPHTIFANASTCTLDYEPTNAPWVFDVAPGERARLVVSS